MGTWVWFSSRSLYALVWNETEKYYTYIFFLSWYQKFRYLNIFSSKNMYFSDLKSREVSKVRYLYIEYWITVSNSSSAHLDCLANTQDRQQSNTDKQTYTTSVQFHSSLCICSERLGHRINITRVPMYLRSIKICCNENHTSKYPTKNNILLKRKKNNSLWISL